MARRRRSRRAMDAANWIDEEPPIRPTLGRLFTRLLRRGRVTWWLWTPLAVLVAAGATYSKGRHRIFEATVVLQVMEGAVRTPGAELGAGSLRAQVQDLAFTSPHLLEVMARHPRDFLDVTSDPSGSVEDFRKDVDLVITDNDFVEERAADDPPRAAHIAISVRSPRPELSLSLARDLAALVVRSTLNLQQEALARQQAAAASALERAEAETTHDDDDDAAGAPRGADDPRAEAARQRLRLTVAAATSARLAKRAGEEQQTLHFDLVDAGRVPRRPTKMETVQSLAITLALALLALCLVAGAFDPRILSRDDLLLAQVTPLGEIPSLPIGRPLRSAGRSGGEMPESS